MIREYKKIIFILLAILLVSSPLVNAVSFGQGLMGSQKDVLSRVDTFAGNGSFAFEDGNAFSASFGSPYSMAVLPDGSLVVSDSRNQRIRKITDGQVQTYAGITFENDIYGNPVGGWSDGDNNLAVFSNPSGITADKQGNVYIADAGNNSIRVISLNGQVTTVAGDGLIGHQDGAGEDAKFYHPLDVVIAKDGTLYVADTLNHLIRKIAADGQVSTLNAVSERSIEIIDGMAKFVGDYLDGDLQEAKFNEPSGLALDRKGNLYVSDSGNQLLRYIDFATNTVTTVAGNIQESIYSSQANAMYAEGGFADGSALESSFNFPKGLAVTEEGGVLIADSLNHRIRYLFDGRVTTLAGDSSGRQGNADGINGYNQLHNPTDVLVLEDGSILIADSYNNLIRKFTLYQLPENLSKDKEIKIVMDSKVITLDTLMKIVNGRIMVPIKSYAKEMGYSLKFTDDEKTIFLINGDVSIEFTIDNNKIVIQNASEKTEKTLEITPFVDENIIYLPLRVLSEELNMDVQWNHENQTVILREIDSKIKSSENTNKHLESFREAKIEEVVGIVQISRAGGVDKFRAFEGMTLYQGDHIITDANSSLVFKIPDSGDEVTIGEKAQLYISNLSNISEGKKTRIFIWSGSVWIHASTLVNSEDEFEIETPEGSMDIQGTNLLVGVDPVTGESKFFIASGLANVNNRTRDNSGGAILYPSQQLNITSDTDENLNEFANIIDLNNFINQVNPEIIEAIIKNKQAIDEENESFIQSLKSQQLSEQQINQAELDRINSNLDNLVGNIVNSAIQQNKVSEDAINRLIDQVNQQIDRKIDLGAVEPLQLSEAEKQKQEQFKRFEEQRKQQLEQEKQRQEELKKQNDELLGKLNEQKEKQEAARAKAQEEAKKRAEEELKKKLDAAAIQAFEAKRKALEEQKKQQDDAVKQTNPIPTQEPRQGGTSGRRDDSDDSDDSDEPEQPISSPTLILVSPKEEVYISEKSVEVVVRTENNNTVTLSLANSDISTATSGSGLGTNVILMVEVLEDGEYDFTLQAMDNDGNVTTLNVPRIIIDTIAPHIEYFGYSVEEGPNNTINILFEFMVEQGATFKIFRGDEDIVAEGIGKGDIDDILTLSNLSPEGEFNFLITATDLAGNKYTEYNNFDN